jgi:4-amino-4-deoxychorismate lyase
MLQLIETICFENGHFQRINLHEERLNRFRLNLFGSCNQLLLRPLLRIPASLYEHKVRCRVTYSDTIENIEYEQYFSKNIRSLKLVWDDSIEYPYKYKNRDNLNNLLSMRCNADEILIVKNGMITDTSFTNIVFLKRGRWYTPELPLLAGTRRADYLKKKQILPAIIRPDDLNQYEEAKLINSMRSIEEVNSISISQII